MLEEKIMNELRNSATKLGITEEEAVAQFNAICEQNGYDSTDESQSKLALLGYRNWHRQQVRTNEGGNSGEPIAVGDTTNPVRKGIGVIVGDEGLRDMGEWARNQALAVYLRDNDSAYNNGEVAIVVKSSDGYQIAYVHPVDGEKHRDYADLPTNSMSVETDEITGEDCKWIIPLETRTTLWNGTPNPALGKPLALHNYRRTVHFIGGDLNAPEKKRFVLTKQTAKDWDLPMFTPLWLDMRWNEDGVCFALGRKTLTSWVALDTLDEGHELYVSPDMFDVQNLIVNHLSNYVTDLVGLDATHTANQTKEYNERLVVTDGSVSNMNMTVNEKTGSRTLYVTDLNMEYSYEEDTQDSVAVWCSENINIDFGVGSDVIIIGRTSQGMNKETGEPMPVSMQAFGVFCTQSNGAPSEPTTWDSDGEDEEVWF